MATFSSQPKTDFIGEDLTCRICREMFDKENRTAKILGCMHTFCQLCVDKMMEGRPDVLCPYCKRAWSTPPSGFPVNTLVMNHLEQDAANTANRAVIQHIKCGNCPDEEHPADAVGFCNDCDLHVCKTCIETHKRMRVTSTHEIETLQPDEQLTDTPIRRRSSKPRCRRHAGQLLTVFCATCNITLCNTCCITTHDGHQRIDLQTAVDKSRRSLAALSQQGRKTRQPIYEFKSTLDTAIGDLEAVCAQQQSAIEEVFHKLEKLLRERCEESKLEVHTHCQDKRKILECQQNEVEGVCAEYASASEYADQVCNVSNPEEFMVLQQQVSRRLEELIKRDNSHIQLTTPLTNNHLRFDDAHAETVDDLYRLTNRLCHVRTSNTLPSLCHVEPFTIPSCKQAKGAMINRREQKMTVQSMSYCNGEPRKNDEGGELFTAVLTDASDNATECPVNDNSDGTYTVSYTPIRFAEHRLEVSLFGTPISGSPFRFTVHKMKYTPVHRGGSKTTDDGLEEAWQCTSAIAGVPHTIDLDAFKATKSENGELEAKVDVIKAEIRTDNGTVVASRVVCHKGHAEVKYTPPKKVSTLWLLVTVNSQNHERREILVTSLENSLFSWEQQPVMGQRCKLTVGIRDHAKKEFKMDSANIDVTVHNTQNPERVSTHRPSKRAFDSKHDFECDVLSTGAGVVNLRVNATIVKTIGLEILDRLQLSLLEDPSSFPTSVDTSSSGVIFLSETKSDMIHVRGSNDKRFPGISVDTDGHTAQIAVDGNSTIFILDPESRQVLLYTNKGRKVSQWTCNKTNAHPVNIATCKHEGDLVAIGDADASRNALFIYQKNGTCVSSVALPSDSLADGLDNICLANRNHGNMVLVCHHSSPEILEIELTPDECVSHRSFPTRSIGNQLAITTTPEGLVLVSERGQINAYDLTDGGACLQDEACIETRGHIYTSLAVTDEGCVVGLEIGERQLVKYGYLHLIRTEETEV